MSNTSKQRIVGRLATFTCTTAGSAVTTDWENLDMTVDYEIADATAASSTYKQQALTVNYCEGTVTGWLGANGIPPAIGDTIDAIGVQESTNDLTTDDFTSFGTLRVTKVNYKFQKDPSKYQFEFKSGVLV